MFGSDWRKFAKTFGVGLAAVAFVTVLINLAFFAGISSGYQEADTQRHRAEYTAQTDQRIATCEAQNAGASRVQCIREAVETGHEEQRDEADLSAQRDMAKWAGWLLVIALLQLPIGTIGLFFLLRSVWQGHEALEHAKKTAETQLRPYLYVGRIRIKKRKGDGAHVIRATFLNAGFQHVEDFYIGLAHTVTEFPMPTNLRDTVIDEHANQFPFLRPRGTAFIYRKLELTDAETKAIDDCASALWCCVTIRYRPSRGAEMETVHTERIFIGHDLKDRVPRIIPEWAYKEPQGDEQGQEHLDLRSPEEEVPE